MTEYAEGKRTTVDLEDLLTMVQRQKKQRTAQPKERAQQSRSGQFSVTTVVIVAFVIALGTMVTILKTEIATLKSELGELKNFKAQVASMDPKLELASVQTNMEKRLGDAAKEGDKMKAEIAQLRAGMEELKVQKKRVR